MQYTIPLLVVTSRTLHFPAIFVFYIPYNYSSPFPLFYFTRWTLPLLFIFSVSYIFISRSYFEIHMYSLLENSAQAGMTILYILSWIFY